MISKKAKYALKALEYITKNKDRGHLLISEISEKQHIPKKFLEVILLELKRDAILQSKMGKNGGYTLRSDPKEVTVGHIIRLIDGPIALIPCVSYKFYQRCEECEDETTCGLRNVMAEVREANNKILSTVTLYDIVKRELKLKKMMGIN